MVPIDVPMIDSYMYVYLYVCVTPFYKIFTLERSYSTLIVHDHDLQALLTTFGSVTLGNAILEFKNFTGMCTSGGFLFNSPPPPPPTYPCLLVEIQTINDREIP